MASLNGVFNNTKLGEKQKEALKEVINEEGIMEPEVIIGGDNEKGNNFMGEMIQLQITGKNKHGKQIVKNLFVKSAPTFKAMRELAPLKQFYSREVHAYNFVLPAMREIQEAHNLPEDQRVHFIKCYKSSLVEYNEFIIMDDMTPKGFKMFSRKEALNIDHMRLVMRHIAYFHSLSFALKTHNPQLYEELSTNIESDYVYSENAKFFYTLVTSQAIKYIEDPLHRTTVENFIKNVYDKVYKITDPKLCDPYNVICHGDFWSNNVIFKYEDGLPSELRFVDWQMVKHCSPLVDLSHLMFCATEQSLRREHYQELLDLYYSSLSLSLQRLNCDVALLYPRHIFDQQIKDISQYGFVLTTISLTFLMREGDDIINVEEEAVKDRSLINMGFKNQKSVIDFKHRFNGVIADFIAYGLIEN